eukprot:CAMPEP_0169098418 /NCGR_PEP_ID=MMETSP1015-20121227/20032_1 /TAXON_ID=342587 /ORGANISM="Karlodinium micrum, Strain CCMP2283" /LENGTH=145 /DNA_ID=CAMNT_0009159269 /DNA_START=1987 /DNA_END=2424 /DNA_ORIENTATION=+
MSPEVQYSPGPGLSFMDDAANSVDPGYIPAGEICGTRERNAPLPEGMCRAVQQGLLAARLRLYVPGPGVTIVLCKRAMLTLSELDWKGTSDSSACQSPLRSWEYRPGPTMSGHADLPLCSPAFRSLRTLLISTMEPQRIQATSVA